MSPNQVNNVQLSNLLLDEKNDRNLLPIDVAVSIGEFLSQDDLALRLVQKALGTNDVAVAREFLQQSGFRLEKELPRTSENGKFVYRFAPDEKFLKSVESFKKTGQAIPLGDKVLTSVESNGVRQIEKTALRPQISPAISQAKPKQIFYSAPNSAAPKKSEYTDVELDAKQFITATKGKDGKLHAVVKGDGDPRQEIYRAAMNQQFGNVYPADVIETVLNGRSDENSIYARGTSNVQSKEQVVSDLLSAAQNNRPYKFGIHNNTRKDLVRLNIELHGSEQDKLQWKISDSLTAIDEKFAKIEPANLLHQSVLAMQKESEKKAAIDALTIASTIDFRGNATDAELYANQTADVIERVTRTLIDSNPIYAALPKAAKDELVKGTVGFLRGGYGLYQTAKGVGDFVNDGLTDTALSVLKSTGLDKQIGVDAGKAQEIINGRRANEAEYARAIAIMGTAQMSQADAALSYKQAAGLGIKPYDLPNWTAKGGELTAKALPYIAIGIATGGVGAAVGGGARGLLAEIGVSGAATGLMGTGENYSLQREYIPAIKAGAMAAAQGAVAPLSNRLGLGGDLTANTVYSVALGKLEGKSDTEVFQDAVMQNALGLGMQVGTRAHEAISAKLGKTEFTRPEAQAALKQIFRQEVGQVAGETAQKVVRQIEVETVAAHIASKGTLSNARESVNSKVAELQTRGSNLKAKLQTAQQEIVAGWGANNKLVTREQMQAARESISQKLQASSRQANIAVDPSVLADFARLATGHLEAGARSLETFKTAMQSEAKIQRANLSEADYQKLYAEAANNKLSQIKGKLLPKAQSEFETLRASMGDEKLLTSLSDDEVKVVKKFEGMATSKAKQATNQVESQKRFEQTRQTLLDDQQFLHGNEVKKGLSITDSTQRTNALRSAISVETTKQELVKQYPAVQGYKVASEVDLYQDTGFKTFKEWSSANGGKAPTGLEEINGKVWRKATDLDIVVVKENADGKLELIQLEQIKAGDNDTASKASSQMQISVEALQNANKIEVLLRNSSDKTVLGKVDAASAATVKKVTRGLPGKGGFDESLPLNSPQMKQIAAEIELLKQKGVIK